MGQKNTKASGDPAAANAAAAGTANAPPAAYAAPQGPPTATGTTLRRESSTTKAGARASLRKSLLHNATEPQNDKPWLYVDYEQWLAGEHDPLALRALVWGSLPGDSVPLTLGSGVSVASVSCGARHAVAITTSGELYTWGANDFGQLGRAPGGVFPFPERMLFALHLQALEPKIVSVSCGARHTAALTDGSILLAMGDNSAAQCGVPLGQPPRIVYVASRLLPNGAGLAPLYCSAMVCGDAHTLAVAVSGEVWAFGDNSAGQLGVGDRNPKPNGACLVEGLLGIPVARIAAGALHSGAVTACGAVFVWGSNSHGQLGTAEVAVSMVPYSLQYCIGLETCALQCAGNQTFLLTRTGALLAFGDCAQNQLGLRSNDREVPATVKRPTAVHGLPDPVCAFHVCAQGGAAITWNEATGARSVFAWGEGITQTGNTVQLLLPGDEAPAAVALGGGMAACVLVGPLAQAARMPSRVEPPNVPYPFLDGNKTIKMISLANSGRASLKVFAQYLKFAMSHPVSLNASFLHPTLRFKQSGTVSGLEMEQVRAVFIEIQKLSSPLLYTSMLEGACAAVQYLYDYRLAHSAEIVRMFLVLLDTPVLLNPDGRNRKLLEQMLFCMLGLPPMLKTTLLSYVGEHKPPFFIMPVQVFERFLSHLVQTGGNERSIYNCVLFLSHLNQINEVKHHVPYQQLYNEQLNSLPPAALEQEYWRWRNRQFSFCQYPFLLGASTKSELLQIDAQVSMKEQMESAILSSVMRGEAALPYLVLVVRRENLIADALAQIGSKPPEALKKPLKIKFIGEEGIDAGGVKKEFFQLLTRAMLDPNYAMFTYAQDTRCFWFNLASADMSAEFGLVGTMVGLAIYNSVILDLPFPMCVYKKLCGKEMELEDVAELQPQTHRNLKALLAYTGADVEDVFCLDFSVSYEYFGAQRTVELKPNGASIAVNHENKAEYVALYTRWLLTESIAPQFDAFSRGFRMVGGPTLSIFRPEELELAACGSENVNIDELESTTTYKGGFTRDSKVIKWFWAVVRSWPVEKQKKLLTFATGSDRIPIKGLAHMGFIVQNNTPDTSRLPTASTCFNTLLLPAYSSLEQLREKLDLAIENGGAGFGLK